MDALWRIQLLGGMSVRLPGDSGTVTRFPTRKAGSLLAYLALHSARPHPREELVERFWPDSDPDAGRLSLRVALSGLRRQLEPSSRSAGTLIRTDRHSAAVDPAAMTTDVREFEAALASAARHAGEERAARLAAALALYRGELLPGDYEEWVFPERQHLADLHYRALVELTACREGAGDLGGALGYARQAAGTDPLREAARCELMRLLVLSGEPAAALRQYRELERLLERDLGRPPGPAARRLAQEIEEQLQDAGSERKVAPHGSEAVTASRAGPAAPPSGTVTFLFTDIERSTAEWERDRVGFREALARHHRLLRRQFERHGGYEVTAAGDGFVVAFPHAGQGLACAVGAQTALAAEPDSPQVRMALHTGDVELERGEYSGLVLHRASRIVSAAHGGQVLCSEATAAVLRRDLPPGTRLADLGIYRLRDVPQPERLFQVEYPGVGRREFPPLRAAASHRTHLPVQLTRFFGRSAEIEELARLLAPAGADRGPLRLLTLTGLGGSGKTRLAQEVARRLVDVYGGSVWFVSLAEETDPRRLPEAVLAAMRVTRRPSVDPLQQLLESLSGSPALLLLDNLEQLLVEPEETASVLTALIRGLPSLRCLVTSRQRLNLEGEHEYAVAALPVPLPGTGPAGDADPAALLRWASVQLFVDRAQAARPGFQVTPANIGAVTELCRRLEGLPLAIELAAARAQVLTPAQMLLQLERRFEFLVSHRHGIAERHRTLRAALDWSYHSLPPELQRFFAWLSVFREGATLDAVEAVCLEPLALVYLEQLRERSLLLAEDDRAEIRFRMLDSMREYGAEHLSAADHRIARGRHAGHFLALAERPPGREEETAWIERLEGAHENLRAAFAWSLGEGADPEAAARLTLALWPLWTGRGRWQEARDWAARALASPELTAAPWRARLQEALASLPEGVS